MQTHQLERMLRLANKTGGKLIITDAEGNRPVVILGLDEYEALLDQKPTDVVRRASGKPVAQRPVAGYDEERAEYPTSDVRRNDVPVIDEDEADVTLMEEALLAVEESMPEAVEEPKMVPVKVEESEAEVPISVQKERNQPARPAPIANEVGEEQFYLEPL